MIKSEPVLVADAVEAADVDNQAVTVAEQEAAEAVALVAALEQRVIEGDEGIGFEEIEAARGLGRFARLRAEATRRKVERARQAARLRALDDLRAEVEQYGATGGERLVRLLGEVERAVSAFQNAVDQRNKLVDAWSHRAVELGAPAHHAPCPPPAEHGMVGQMPAPGRGVIAGARRLSPLDGDAWLARVLRPTSPGGRAWRFRVGPLDEAMAEHLAKLDAPAAEPADDALWFRHTGSGQVIQFDHAPDVHEARGLVEITRAEALGA